MEPSGPGHEDRRSRFERNLAIAASLALATTSIVSLVLPLTERFSYYVPLEALLTIVTLVAWLAATVFVIRYLRRVRYRDLRIAVTGLPSAGKTVLSVALFDALMGERRDGGSFTAQTKTVMSVYQAIRGISAGSWPVSTTREIVNRYEGKVYFRRARVILDLEWGDSAGEYWAEFPDPDRRDADYLSYVASADAVAHVIPIDWLLKDPDGVSSYRLLDDIADLQLAARLARPLAAGGKSLPLLIAITKLDAVGLGGMPWLFHVFTSETIPLEDFDDAAVSGQLEKAVSLLQERLQGQFASVHFTLTAIQPALEARVPDEEISLWMLDASRLTERRGRRDGFRL